MKAPPRSRLRRAARNDYLWAATFLALLLAIFFSPIVRSHATFSSVANLQRYYYPWIETGRAKPPDPLFPQADQADFVYPRQVFLDTTLRQAGDLPRWNPDTLGGTPFMAQTGSRLAYPPMLAVTLLFNPVHAHDVYVIVHLFAAGMVMFALMKAFGARFAGALLSAVSWAFASYTLGWIMLEMFAAVAALLPLALLFVHRWHARRSRSDLVLGTLALGLLILGTSLELALLAYLVVTGYAGALALRRLYDDRSKLVVRRLAAAAGELAILVVGSLAMAAIAVVPFMALSGSSQRRPLSRAQQLSLSVPVRVFAHLLAPPAIPSDIGGRVAALISTQVFVGTATAALALAGLLKRRAGRGLGAALVVLLFMFTTGSFVARATYAVVPFLSRLAGAGRALFVFGLGLAILGGLGLDTVVAAMRRVGPRSPAVAVRRAGAVVLAIACVAATSVQLLSYGRRVNPPFQSRDAADLLPSRPVVEAVKDVTGRDAGRERVLVAAPATGSYTLVSTTGLALDLSLVNGYEPVVPANVSAIWRVVNGEAPGSALARPWNETFQLPFASSAIRTELLGRLGVAAVVGPPGGGLGPGWTEAEAAKRGLQRTYAGSDGQVFAVRDTAPRALVVSRSSRVSSEAEALDRFTSPAFDVRKEVLLEGKDAGVVADAQQAAPAPPAPSRVEWLRDDPDDLRLAVDAPTAGWLVLLDNWDSGWTATVDGRAAAVRRANFTQRAVRVPAGRSTVSFSYRPSALRAGATVTATTTTVLLAVLVVEGARRRRTRRRQLRRARLQHVGVRET